MPDEKAGQKRPAQASTAPSKAQQDCVDATGNDSFPASDPPAWTTTGRRSVAARRREEGAPALDDVRTATGAQAATQRREADAKASSAQAPLKPRQGSDPSKG